MKNLTLLTMAACVLAVPAAAFANDDKRSAPPPMKRDVVQKQLSDQFSTIDTNKDGFIDRAEIDAQRAAMKKKWEEKRTERLNAHFNALDSNKDGQISKAEFDAFHAARANRHSDGKKDDARDPNSQRATPKHNKHMKSAMGHHRRDGANQHYGAHKMNRGDMLARLDSNKDGKISLAEFSAPALNRFDAADTNKDGVVTPEERRAASEKSRQKARENMKERASKRD